MSYNRNLSPGGRRIVNPARASDSNVDGYLIQRHNSYVSPRSSGERVIPISTQTFLNVAPSSSSGRTTYDSYSGRPTRRNSMLDQARSPTTGSTRRPNVIQGSETTRTSSPPRTREYYVVPATSKEPRKTEHRKVYAIDDGGAKLVTEPSVAGAESTRHHRHHRRQESEERSGHKEDRARRGYPTTRKDKSIDDDDAFSYTDPAGMFRDTQPSWRERDNIRPRRNSGDRGVSKERVVSMVDTHVPDPRRSREGPPTSQRGWDKINENIGRTRSVKEGPREVAQSPSRGRAGDLRSPVEPYQSTRRTSVDRSRPAAVHHDQYDSLDEYDYEPRDRQRIKPTITKRADRSVSRRGFGIRSDSKDRHDTHYSDENLDDGGKREFIRDEPRRQDHASDAEYREPVRRKHADDREVDDRDARYNDRRPEVDRYDHDTDDRRRRYRDERDRRQDDDDQPHGRISDTAKLAAGGVAGATALYGLSKDRDRPEDTTHEPEQRKSRREPEHDKREAPYPERYDDDRGLGFAFEGPSNNPAKVEAPSQDASHDRTRDLDRDAERSHGDVPAALMPEAPIDPDEDYRRRMLQAQRDLGLSSAPTQDADPDRERRRREREARLQGRHEKTNGEATPGAYPQDRSSPRSSFNDDPPESSVASSRELRRRPSIIDQPMPSEPTAQIIDNSLSEKRENRVRIVDPPTEEEDRRPKGILKRPTVKFPEDHNSIREGVAPLKDATKKGIPPGARWTKIDRRLVNPEALEEAKERYEERLDCVIVLRVLTKEEIQKLADRTKELRDKRFEAEGKSTRRRDRDRDRRDRDEYSDDGLEDWERDEQKPVRMLEGPAQADNTDRRDRRDREGSYVSSRSGRD